MTASRSILGNSYQYGGKGHELYFVYMNNLSSAMTDRFHDSLRRRPEYVGFLDLDCTTEAVANPFSNQAHAKGID